MVFVLLHKESVDVYLAVVYTESVRNEGAKVSAHFYITELQMLFPVAELAADLVEGHKVDAATTGSELAVGVYVAGSTVAAHVQLQFHTASYLRVPRCQRSNQLVAFGIHRIITGIEIIPAASVYVAAVEAGCNIA